MESKREKFLRLANARTNKILEMLNLLGNLSNTSNYEYSQKDVNLIFKAIEQEIKENKKKFFSSCVKINRFNLED